VINDSFSLGLIDHDAAWLFIGVAGVLILASAITALLSWRVGKDKTSAVIVNLHQRVVAWWVMVAVLAGALILGESAVVVLFYLLSLLALREFITISPTHQKDHKTLIWVFFVVPLIHYWFVWQHLYGMFAVFIPVYVFLFLPARNALVGETKDFLQRSAVIQWALMVCVFAISFVPSILHLPTAIALGREGAHGAPVNSAGPAGAKLLLFFVLVVQISDVLQYVWGKTLGKHPVAPKVSPNKTWEGFIGGILSATGIGAALWWLTPFNSLQAAGLAFVSCLLGFAGGLVMSSIKRDRGVEDFGSTIPGHGGIMDRLDSLYFAAPVFFHLVRFFFTT